MATKTQIIAEARSMGVPASLLSGTKADIQAAITDWQAAQQEASQDTANAISGESATEAQPTRPRDTAAGPWMLLGVALFG